MKCCVNIVRHVEKLLALFFVLLLSLSACSDYAADYDDKYGHMLAEGSEDDSESSFGADQISSSAVSQDSSADVIPSEAEESSSSVASSSSAKSSSSVASSSSAKSSSSVASSSSAISYGTLTDSRDNRTYKTVTIGTQTWMAENLNYAYNNPTSSLDSSSFCYNNRANSCAKYGRLYLWSAAMDSAAVFSTAGKGCGDGKTCNPSGTIRGVCPEGWHLPSKDEWNTLFTAVGGIGTAGTKLKSTSGWDNDGNGTDAFGFSGSPAGIYNSTLGYYSNVDRNTSFWSSTEYLSDNAYYMTLYDRFEYAGLLDYGYKSFAWSVRCLRNSEDSYSSSSSSQAKSSSSSSAKSSSSVASSSSAKSSSSVASSSSVRSSSSVASSSSAISYGTLTDSRDNQTYKTVTIGTQTWMAENLNYDYNEGTAKSFCYSNSTANCDKYGRLYLWSAAMDSAAVFSTAGKGCGDGKTCASTGSATFVRGVCPEGWHLPSKNEWNTLFTAVGGEDAAGMKLKSTSGWANSGDGENMFGFSVLPAGEYFDYYGDFRDVGYVALFWSSIESGSDNGYIMFFNNRIENVYAYGDAKGNGHSVRCIKDE